MDPEKIDLDTTTSVSPDRCSSKDTDIPKISEDEAPAPLISAIPSNDADTEASLSSVPGGEHAQRILAQTATQIERSMSTKKCLSMYSFAIACSICLSMACVMEGYDLVLITGFLAFPIFRRDYACPDAPLATACEIPAQWQSGIVVGPQVGQVIGVYLNGYCVERYGYKKTYIGALIALTCFILVVFFSNSLPIFLVGMVLCGIPWGIFQTLTTNYASDVCPTTLRAYITAWGNVCWIIGQLVGSIVLRAVVEPQRELSYKLPLGLQWAFPIPLLVCALFVPESPWWLVRHDKIEEARKALRRLIDEKLAPSEFTIDGQLQMMILTNKEEHQNLENSGGTGYLDCFKGKGNMRRTEITTVIWMIQNASGSALMAFSPYFFEQAGMGSSWAFTFVIIQYGLGLVGTIVSWILINKLGRRTIEFGGLSALCCILILIGVMSLLPIARTTAGYAIGSLLLVYTFVYGSTVGPVTYSIVSELSSTRLKSKTINIARMSYNVVGIFNSIITPYQLNPTAWNWGARTAWFWAGMCCFCAAYVFYRLPEVKGRTFGDIDWLFNHGVPARKFKTTKVPDVEVEEKEGSAVSSSGRESQVVVSEIAESAPRV